MPTSPMNPVAGATGEYATPTREMESATTKTARTSIYRNNTLVAHWDEAATSGTRPAVATMPANPDAATIIIK